MKGVPLEDVPSGNVPFSFTFSGKLNKNQDRRVDAVALADKENG
jgi:hypothetical protein